MPRPNPTKKTQMSLAPSIQPSAFCFFERGNNRPLQPVKNHRLVKNSFEELGCWVCVDDLLVFAKLCWFFSLKALLEGLLVIVFLCFCFFLLAALLGFKLPPGRHTQELRILLGPEPLSWTPLESLNKFSDVTPWGTSDYFFFFKKNIFLFCNTFFIFFLGWE